MSKFVVIQSVIETVCKVPDVIAEAGNEVILAYVHAGRECAKGEMILGEAVVPYVPLKS